MRSQRGRNSCIRLPKDSHTMPLRQSADKYLQNVVRRQDENSLLTPHCFTTGHALDRAKASVTGNGFTRRTWGFIEAWTTTPTCDNQCTSRGFATVLEALSRRPAIVPIFHVISLSVFVLNTPPPIYSDILLLSKSRLTTPH